MLINTIPESFIENKVQEICKSISKEGEQSSFTDIFLMIHEYIQDNLEKFLPEKDYDINN